MQIELKILDKEFYPEAKYVSVMNVGHLPFYATPGSAAIDLVCTEDVTIYPGGTKQIPTGIAIHIGSHTDSALRAYREHWDYAGLILPRSGLGAKGLILANTVGLIDSDYQGELLVQAWNRNGIAEIELKAGDRFSQLVIMPVVKAQWTVVEEFTNSTDRADGGFGHTGD